MFVSLDLNLTFILLGETKKLCSTAFRIVLYFKSIIIFYDSLLVNDIYRLLVIFCDHQVGYLTSMFVCTRQHQVLIETDDATNQPVCSRLVLEFGDEEKRDAIVEVNKKLVKQLKPHQADGEPQHMQLIKANRYVGDCFTLIQSRAHV